ncbi:hypothetical protein TBAG_02331 [Mycobacterium tuberculosis 94_M4241A]|nr:hypothetical protein TBAG_02331 [Mycobacterium tuberculosis 94_M4241A]
MLDGWRERGHGDFRDIRGVMWHHTGNSRETAKSIARGRPDLPGPLANLHIAHSGVVTIVAVGVCWHAGRGSYPWLPTDNANWHMIGVECAWPTIRRDGSYDAGERWPDAQIVSMRDVAAALTLKLGYGPERNIGHKEYAGAAQGKWGPGKPVDGLVSRRGGKGHAGRVRPPPHPAAGGDCPPTDSAQAAQPA